MTAPASNSTLLRFLENIPIWKVLRQLPKRIVDLEARVAVLEQRMAGRQRPTGRKTKAWTPRARVCDQCHGEMVVEGERAHPTAGKMGLLVHDMRCLSCGSSAARNFNPSHGYERLAETETEVRALADATADK